MEYDILKYKIYWKEKAKKEKEKMEHRRKSMISAIKKCASILKEKYNVKKIILFGSLSRERIIDEHSDIDIAVVGLDNKKYFEALNLLYEIVPKGVDIDLITIESIDEEFRKHILKKGIVIE